MLKVSDMGREVSKRGKKSASVLDGWTLLPLYILSAAMLSSKQIVENFK